MSIAQPATMPNMAVSWTESGILDGKEDRSSAMAPVVLIKTHVAAIRPKAPYRRLMSAEILVTVAPPSHPCPVQHLYAALSRHFPTVAALGGP